MPEVVIRQSLSLCLIAWNEAETIGKVIEAFSGLYTELLIRVDRKSTDKTYQVAESYKPDFIEYFDFENDFSAARNPLIDRAKGEWVFFPDAHEIMIPDSRGVIRDILENPEKHAGIDLISPMVYLDLNEFQVPQQMFPRPMLFRNGKGIRFQDPTHNYLDCPEEHKAIAPQIVLIHAPAAYRNQPRSDLRNTMNPVNLQKMLEDDPDDSRAKFYLANTFYDTGKWDDAVYWYEKLLEDHGKAMFPDYMSHVLIMLASLHFKRKDWNKVRAVCYEAIQLRWDRAEPYVYLGHICQEQELWDEGAHWYRVASTMPPPISTFFLIAEKYAYEPWEGMMLCLNKMGLTFEALIAARKVLEYKPNDREANENVRLLEEAMAKRVSREIIQKSGLKVQYSKDRGFAFSTRKDIQIEKEEPVP